MILVLGSGRSGTSEVSKTLHEGLGVSMGQAFQMKDKFNPIGIFEDEEFQDMNVRFLLMGINNSDEGFPVWREKFKEVLDKKKEPFGIKDPAIADFPELLNEYMKLNPKVIYCTRDRADTITSFKRVTNLTTKQAEDMIDTRTKNITRVLKNTDYLEVKCNQPYEDKEKLIRAFIK